MQLQAPKWIQYSIPGEWEDKAKGIRKKRDDLYGNIFAEEDSDLRWVGDLGEIVFNDWLKSNGISNFHWHEDNAAGKPDFTVNSLRIDVKTVKRKVPPRSDYTAQITAQHITHPIDELFFMSYQFQERIMWLLGGLPLKKFLSVAVYYGEGQSVHKDYVIRKGHEIYNAEISLLVPPKTWVERLNTDSTSVTK